MELSLTMQFVQTRSNAEARAARSQSVGMEHLFLGILKLSETRTSDLLDRANPRFAQVEEDISAVKSMLHAAQIESTRARALMRYLISRSTPTGEAALDACLRASEQKARSRGAQELWAQDMLRVLMEQPSDMILQVCPVQSNGRILCTAEQAQVQEEESADEMSRGFLPALTNRIRKMRAQLLQNVLGQDHVVHAFAEGMFAAEVLAASDDKRKRPRAIFVFAGPPGVGKTFLAEQAAAAMGIPYKRFDMSSFADHQSYMALVGYEKTYQGAKPGTLTEFVSQNPHSILLFDEIEKAHLNTINLFLQVLDAGRLNDRYYDQNVVFRDTIIIFTSNACKTLYEGEARENAAGVPRITLLNALETELNPQTNQPFFPPAITSRMATGWPLLFNHLQAQHLERISRNELARMGSLFEAQYGIKLQFDTLIPTALMLQEGGKTEARTLRAQTEQFFKNEIFKMCRLWGENSFARAIKEIRSIHFNLDTAQLSPEVKPLFVCEDKPEILLYCSLSFAMRCMRELPAYRFHRVHSLDAAMTILGERDVRFALIDVIERGAEANNTLSSSSFASLGSSMIEGGTKLFRTIRARMPELPVYLLETEDKVLDPELEMNFLRSGVRGKLVAPKNDFSVFEDMLASISRELYMQSVAVRMGTERKALSFDTAPSLSDDGTKVNIRVHDFSIKRAIAADDMDSVLDDVEKPSTRFADVIGAQNAKDELEFFISYLKNPKRFTAQGVKPPKGVLLYGPPGTGKTMLARAMAGESDVTFIPCAATGFVTAFQGSGPEAIRTLFRRARRYAPAIIFIDEIDSIGRKRGNANTGHGEEMALNALLAEMDGFTVDPKRPVFVLAATNFEVEEGRGGLGVIDPALLRRFDRRILVDLPDTNERERFIRMTLSRMQRHSVSEAMIKRLASRSAGMSPAILSSVLEDANRTALKAEAVLDDAMLDEAFEVSKHGEQKNWGYAYLERVARHEAGHALLSYLAGDKPAYLTIIARGDHGGYMEHANSEKEPIQTRSELISRIRTCLGGRAAEQIYYGEQEGRSSGASGDLQQASRLAYAMICLFGMDEEFGLCALEEFKPQPEALRARINALLKHEFEMALSLLNDRRGIIDRLVNALMHSNKLNEQEITAIIEQES